MKKLIYIVVIALSFALHRTGQAQGQSIPASPVTFGTVADLRAQGSTLQTQVLLNGLATVGDGNGGMYMWNPTSTATDDGFITIQATGISTGRWIRLGNSNTLKISASTSAISLQNTYTIAFGQTFAFIPRTVIVIPRSANTSQGSYVSTITASNVTIVFNSVPALGTMSVDLIIVKQ